jgi:hypothetical protein
LTADGRDGSAATEKRRPLSSYNLILVIRMSIEDFPFHRYRDYVTGVVVCLCIVSLVGPAVMVSDIPHIHPPEAPNPLTARTISVAVSTSSATATDYFIKFARG